MEKASVYDRIKAALTPEGVLPEEFVLKPQPKEGPRFVDGAMDGVIRYHMGPSANVDIDMLTQALKLASQEHFDDAANALLTYFSQGITMLPVMDKLQDWVYDHGDELRPEQLGRFVLTLLQQSQDAESVKFALTVLEILDQEPTEELEEILLTLASCEELTLFCLFVLSQYEDANHQYFKLAKKLKGWGRIHAVSLLKPEDEEMRDWLLQEGWQNYVMPDYSAITIIKRTKLADLLAGPEGRELLPVAGKLISYSLQDAPVAGLSKYKRTGELLQRYLELAAQESIVTAELKEDVKAVREFVEQGELANKWQIIELCAGILDR